MGGEKQERIRCPRCNWSHVPSTGPLHTGVYQAQCRCCGYSFNFKSTTLPRQSVRFTINGIDYDVSEEDSQMSLHSFLTSRAGLRQAKYTCFAGYCGSCLVSATFADPVLGGDNTVAFNSCLRPVYACDGWHITTTEGLGNVLDGYHPIQERLAEYGGSQCGWCSAGMVMSMYSYMKDNTSPKAEEIEGVFDGNMCRCTGYRPILQAMRTFSENDKACQDIEDLSLNKKMCKKTGKPCNGGCHGGPVRDPIHVILKDADWYAPTGLQELYATISANPGARIHLVMGHTASGLYRDSYDLKIDIKGVGELYATTVTENELTLGSNVTLTHMIKLLTQASHYSGFQYCAGIVGHLNKVANTPVRNTGTWAGNLVLKKMHPEFRSDLFVILETLGATIVVGTAATGAETTHTPAELLQTDLAGKVILKVTLPKVSSNDYIQTFKVMPRSQTATAYINLGIFLTMDGSSDYTVSGSPKIVFNGINSTVYHATATEQFLVGKALGTNTGFQEAVQTLENEVNTLQADTSPLLASEGYRKEVIPALFYRFMLNVLGDAAGAQYRSGAAEIERPLSSGSQDFGTNPELYPVTEPMPKVAAKKQCSGEAEYVNGIPEPPGTLFGQFVLATEGNCTIESIDPSPALALPGVVRFFKAEDIPGINNFFPYIPEELFCSGQILYAGQAIGLIVAESQGTAMVAASMVRVTYTDIQPPILTVQEAIDAGSYIPNGDPEDVIIGDAEGAINNSPYVVEGEFALPDQYHMHMENQICLVIPNEGGLEVFSATQWPDMVQKAVAEVNNITANKIKVQVRRIGGGYGGKISRCLPVATAASLAANLMNRPVKISMTLSSNMKMLGKRLAYIAKYKIGVNEYGKLNGVRLAYYGDGGCQGAAGTMSYLLVWGDNAYRCANWHLSAHQCKTNKPACTPCRSPGAFAAIGIMEYIMDHIAKYLNKDPVEVRRLNFYQEGDISVTGTPLPYCNITEIYDQLVTSANVMERRQQVSTFNQNNRWKKRGLSVVPLKFGLSFSVTMHSVIMNIYNGDGSVIISHGGVEIGQGIHTKSMQVAAYKLGLPMDKITVVPTDTEATANSMPTGGSTTTESICYGIDRCCDILLARLKPVRSKMAANATWQELVQTAYYQGIDLSARVWSWPGSDQEYYFRYFCYGAACAEVELDVLTGHRQVNRVDILWDSGRSINPQNDVGQIEGAFMMGMGNYFQEFNVFDPSTGELLSDNLGDYLPPMSKDIPVDFRVSLLRNAYNPLGVLGAKGVSEPPQCLSISTFLALKDAIEDARAEAGQTESFFRYDSPGTVERSQQMCLNDINHFLLI